MASDQQMLSLNCVFLGDRDDFPIVIANDARVGNLQKLIKAKYSNRLSHIDAVDLNLWKTSIPIDDLPLQDLPIERRLRAANRLSIFQPTDLSEDKVQIVVGVLSLNCFVLGDPWHSKFTVQIPTNRDIGHLQVLVKEEKAHRLSHVGASDLKVSSVSLALDDDAEERLKTTHRRRISPWLSLSEAFPSFKVRHLHVLIELPTACYDVTQATKVLKDVKRDNTHNLRKRYRALVSIILRADTPSSAAGSENYGKSQIAYSIYDGRYPANEPRTSVAPPIQLFNAAFGHFLDAMRSNSAVPERMLRQTMNYMRNASAIYNNKEERRDALTPLLCHLLGFDLEQISKEDETSPEGIVGRLFDNAPSFLLLQERKNELGDWNSDPSTRAGLSVARAWAQDRSESLRNASNCPTFLLATAGPWLAVIGAVITDGVIVQRLTDYMWIGLDTVFNESHITRIARVFYALKSSMEKLDSFYDGVRSRELDDSRYFPSIAAYSGQNGPVNFDYVGYLEDCPDCITLRAKTRTKPALDVAVKFVDRYGERAHKLLAMADLAPNILFCGSPHLDADQPSYESIIMVVMEFIHGSGLSAAQTAMDEENKGNVRTQLRHAIELLHSNKLVFGDLRPPNILVTKDQKVKLIDFDWAGEVGQAKYPPMLSWNILWPEGVKALGVIEQEHDLQMLGDVCSS